MEMKEYINNEIIINYSTEDSKLLADRLGITLNYLRVKAKRTIVNKIVNQTKLCPCCNHMLPVHQFNRDKYQPNQIDYWCKECRNKAKINNISKKNHSMAFGKKKSRNPIIKINGVDCLRCKGHCGKIKPLHQFHVASANVSGHKNFCKQCISDKKKGII